jgi:hypothetical protein
MAFMCPDGYVTAKVHKDAESGGGRWIADPAAAMARARIEGSSLSAAAALVWNGNLPRPLQQVLFDIADSIAS